MTLIRGIGIGFFIELIGAIIAVDLWRLIWIALPQ